MAECGYCKDCRHWNQQETKEYKTCKRIYEPDDWEENDPTLLAHPRADYYGGVFETAPNFGCVLYEPK